MQHRQREAVPDRLPARLPEHPRHTVPRGECAEDADQVRRGEQAAVRRREGGGGGHPGAAGGGAAMPPGPRQAVQRPAHQHAPHRQHHRVQGVPGHPVLDRPAGHLGEGLHPELGAGLQEGAQPSARCCSGKNTFIFIFY